jgi:competence protein ComEC
MKSNTPSWRMKIASFILSGCNSAPRKAWVGRIAAAAALTLSVAFGSGAFSQTMQVHFIDVGQGAATLIEFPCAAILVDTGGENNGDFDSNSELLSYLDDFFGRRSDLKNTLHSLILSHPHIDHTRGVKDVLGRYKILNAVTNGQEEGSGKSGQIALHRRASASESGEGDQIGFVPARLDDIPANRGFTNSVVDPVSCPTIDPKITLLWGSLGDNTLGWKQSAFNNLNNHSAIVRVDFGQSSILIQGDLEESAIPDFVAHYRNSNLLAADVYQVGHHGSANGTTDELLQAVAPKIAVMAMGPDTRQATFSAWGFGHPRKTTVDRLQRFVSTSRKEVTVDVATGQHQFQPQVIRKAIYGTGWDGTVVLEADTDGGWRVVPPTVVASADKIDINTARAEELVGLPMIGESRANAIVDYRNRNGRFTTVDKLLEVKGIGPATLTGIRSRVTVSTGDARMAREAVQPPAIVKADVPPPVVSAGSTSGRVEIVLANGRRVIVDAGVDIIALARLVAALEKP